MVPTFTMFRSTGAAPSYSPYSLATGTPQAFPVASRSVQKPDIGVASPNE